MSVEVREQIVGVSSLYQPTSSFQAVVHKSCISKGLSLCLLVQLVYFHVFRSDEINEAKMNFHLFGFRKKSHGETRILAIRDVTQLKVYLIAQRMLWYHPS